MKNIALALATIIVTPIAALCYALPALMLAGFVWGAYFA